jgi:hypothetical protein
MSERTRFLGENSPNHASFALPREVGKDNEDRGEGYPISPGRGACLTPWHWTGPITQPSKFDKLSDFIDTQPGCLLSVKPPYCSQRSSKIETIDNCQRGLLCDTLR